MRAALIFAGSVVRKTGPPELQVPAGLRDAWAENLLSLGATGAARGTEGGHSVRCPEHQHHVLIRLDVHFVMYIPMYT